MRSEVEGSQLHGSRMWQVAVHLQPPLLPLEFQHLEELQMYTNEFSRD